MLNKRWPQSCMVSRSSVTNKCSKAFQVLKLDVFDFFKGIGTNLETINNLLNVNHAPLLSFAVPEMVVETSTVYHAMNASKYVSGNISQGLKLDGGQHH